MKDMKRFGLVLVVFILAVSGLFLLNRRFISPNTNNTQSQDSSKIKIVAAENFYGDIAKQLGGDHVTVTSLLSDPNVDPHEYESNVQDSVALSQANIVIKNGLGYDTWIDKLLIAAPNPNRVVITSGEIAPNVLLDNPHVWYGIDNVPAVAQAITNSLKKNDPSDATFFDQNLMTFDASLQPLQQKMTELKTKYSGTPIGLTETIYLYQTQAMGLNVLTPLSFERAIAEGNDPSASDVKIANDQLNQKQIRVFIYNKQTATPVTTHLQDLANQKGIPIVAVTETMPQQMTYQTWMMSQLTELEQALQQTSQK